MRLFVAVPTHSGSLSAETVKTIVGLQQLILERGWSLSFHTESGATISVVRNVIAAKFLESEADALLMLDADQAADPTTIVRMIDLGQPFVGCVYPKRRFHWSNVNLDKAKSLDDIFYQASEFVGQLVADADGSASINEGFARAYH